MSNDTPVPREILPDPIWDRISDNGIRESDQAYGAFARYRDMSYDRSLAKVAHELGKSKSLMERWSRRFLWRIRCDEWDRDQETQKAVALNESIKSMAERHANQAAAALTGLMIPHLALARKLRTEEDLINNLSLAGPGELLKLAVSTAGGVRSMMEAERLARGEPTEIQYARIEESSVEVTANLSDDDYRLIAQVLNDAKFFDRLPEDGDQPASPEATG